MDVQAIINKIEDKTLTVWELETALKDNTVIFLHQLLLITEAMQKSGLSNRWINIVLSALHKNVFR